MATLRERILAADDIPSELVDLPKSWGGGQVQVRGLSAGELSDFVTRFASRPAKEQNVQLLIATVRDPESGKPLFEQADRDGLMGKSGSAVMRLVRVSQRLAGLTADEEAAAEIKQGDFSG
jgi:hypothetical protein